MKRTKLKIKRVELVTMEICHTHCIFCQKDCYKQHLILKEATDFYLLLEKTRMTTMMMTLTKNVELKMKKLLRKKILKEIKLR